MKKYFKYRWSIFELIQGKSLTLTDMFNHFSQYLLRYLLNFRNHLRFFVDTLCGNYIYINMLNARD